MDWRGFELHPEVPEGGAELSEILPPERSAGMADYLTRFAGNFGVEGLKIPGRVQNSRRALAVVEHARDLGLADAFRRAAMDAYWRRGENLEDEPTLAKVAERAGLDPTAAVSARHDPTMLARVDALRDEAHAAGVTGIPTWFFGQALPVVGCQPYEQLAKAAEKAGAQRR